MRTEIMREETDDLMPTRTSLLGRLKQLDDQESWRDFFNTYWKLIYRFALKAGLSEAEAQDVVQETVVGVANRMKDFSYTRGVDSFRGWLLYLARKRVAMRYRQRQRERGGDGKHPEVAALPEGIDQIADPAGVELEAIWDVEWERHLLDCSVERVKRQVNPKQFQMFALYVLKERPAEEVAQALGVPVAQVYLAKHRISALVKKEIDSLKQRLI